MNRFLRGAVLLAVTAVIGACSSESGPTEGGTATRIVAEPGVVLIPRGDSQAVKLRVQDQQGIAVQTPISITQGAGINVRADSLYRPVFHGDTLVFNPNSTELQVWVSTTALTNSSFTVSAGGMTLNVPVVVTPSKEEAFEFSSLAPALGDVVTVNSNPALHFTDSTKVVFGSTTITPASIAADGSSLTFNAGPGLVGPATLTNVAMSYDEGPVFSVAASDTMVSPPLEQAFAFSDLSSDFGQQVTITPPAGVKFSATSKATFDSAGSPVPLVAVAPDGSSMTITPGPGSVGPNTFTNMYAESNPTFTFSLKSADRLIAVSKIQPFGFSSLTPSFNGAVTITPPAGLQFTDTTKITSAAGGTPVVTIAGDKLSANVVFGPNAVGPTTFTNMIATSNPAAPFTLVSSDTLESAQIAALPTTVDHLNPVPDQTITVALTDANIKLSSTATYNIAGRPAFVISRAADSSSVTLLPEPEVNGPVTASLVKAYGFNLANLPTDKVVTAATFTPVGGVGDWSSARSFTAPAPGVTQAFWDGKSIDAGRFPFSDPATGEKARLYKLDVPADETITFSLPYVTDGADVAIVVYDADQNFVDAVDSHGTGATNAETGDIDLTAGTYYVSIVWFNYSGSAQPHYYKFSMKGN
jgi:hypothetical protein